MTRRFATELEGIIGPDQDIPAPEWVRGLSVPGVAVERVAEATRLRGLYPDLTANVGG